MDELDMVSSNAGKEVVDYAIGLPQRVYTDDGRELFLTTWAPILENDALVRFSCEGLIKIKRKEANERSI